MDNYESLKVEINNLKDDIKEIKEDNKEMKVYYRDVIGELKENGVRQTEILNKIIEQQDTQNSQQKEQFTKVNNEIADLNEKIDSNIESQNINSSKLFKGILKQIGIGIATIIIAYVLFKFGISTKIK